MKILVFDDEAEVQRIRERLAPRGFEAVCTPSGDHTFHLCESEGLWDLALTELWIIPGKRIKNGKELVGAIEAKNPHQRMAICTADRWLFAAPMPMHCKPYDAGRLVRLLRQPVRPILRPRKDEGLRWPALEDRRTI